MPQERTYRLRANHLTEAQELKKLRPNTEINISTYTDVPDVEVKFKSRLTLPDLAILIASIYESEVMLETLAYEEDYTGGRDYGLSGLTKWTLFE